MSKKQLNRFDVLSKANAGFITVREASEALGLSERQVKRLKKKVRDGGAASVVHGNTGKSPVWKISDEVKAEILELRKLSEYEKCNFKHFAELLLVRHGIEISYQSLYRFLTEEGIKSPKTKRRYKPHRRRKRRPQAGLLLQIDASPFKWFKGNNTMYSLHGGIDDATGQITGLYMCKNECLHGYFEMFRRTISNYGIPVSIYADRNTIFQSPNIKKHELDASVPMNDTQFGRCLKELAVTLIAARSPQAKGRIERLWGTLQDRLPVEFMVHGIKTVEEANTFLEKYIYDFNVNFAVEPENMQNSFRKPRDDENLDYILCVKEKRVIDSGGVFSYFGKSFKIIDDEFPLPAKTQIYLLISSHIGLMAEYKNHMMDVLPFVPPKRRTRTVPKEHVTQLPGPDWRGEVKTNFITIKDRIYESENAYYETVRLIEKTLLGKYR